jgi:GNAT superfamily N-acetyltransferase
MDSLEIRVLSGALLDASIDVIGQMRMDAFREFPYLYDGAIENERRNLRQFTQTPKALVCSAYLGGEFAGIATGAPLWAAIACSLSPADFFYIGEVIVLPEFRHRGIGPALIRRVEEESKLRGFEKTCFLCVERPLDHPLKPKGYQAPDSIWKSLGYTQSEIRIEFEWDSFELSGLVSRQKHTMCYWLKQ